MCPIQRSQIRRLGKDLFSGFVALTSGLLLAVLLGAFVIWAVFVAPYRLFCMTPGETERYLIYATFAFDYLAVAYLFGRIFREDA